MLASVANNAAREARPGWSYLLGFPPCSPGVRPAVQESTMRKPHEHERVQCPEDTSKELLPPLKVFDKVSPDGIQKGILGEHKHYGSDCPWAYHAVPVVPANKKD